MSPVVFPAFYYDGMIRNHNCLKRSLADRGQRLERVAFNQVHLIERDSQHYQRLACLGLHSI